MDNRERFTELSNTYGFDMSNKLLQTHTGRDFGYVLYKHKDERWFVWDAIEKGWFPTMVDRHLLGKLIEVPKVTQDIQEKQMSLADGRAWEKENKQQATAPENSGGSCSYYEKNVYSVALNKVQLVECKDVMTALELNHDEINMFKEIWRSAAARQGKKKEGHTALRGAHKIKFFADENLARVKRQK